MATWNEAEHPRDNEGKFTYKRGESSRKIIYSGIEYNDKKESRENILYKDSSFKSNLSDYRKKLVNYLENNLDRSEILFSTTAELENKILNSTISTIQASKEKLVSSMNKLNTADQKTNSEFQNLVNKAKETYKTLNEFKIQTDNMIKINTQNGQNGYGENAISSVLRIQKKLQKECNEIISVTQDIENTKGTEKYASLNSKSINKSEMQINPIIKDTKEETQIESSMKTQGEGTTTKLFANKTETNWIMPCQGKISSHYGNRKPPVSGASTFHSGIDISVPVGTPVKAITDGKIRIASGGITGYGNAIYINHGNINGKIVESEYGHLSKILVVKGQNVKRGQIIGLSGGG